MRDFLEAICFILALLSLLYAVLGLAYPRIVTPKGKQPPSRFVAFLRGIAGLVLLLVIGGLVAAPTKDVAQEKVAPAATMEVGSKPKAYHQSEVIDPSPASTSASIGAKADQPNNVASQPAGSITDSHIQPEMLVRVPENAFACLTKDDLQEITEHFIKGEITKGKAMMLDPSTQHAGPCIPLSPQVVYKVLSVEYNDPNIPDLGIMEIRGPGSDSADGAWTFTTGAKPVQSPSASN